MKVLVGERSVYEKLKKFGRVAFVSKDKKLSVESDELMISTDLELGRLLEFLADLCYDFVVLKGFGEEIARVEEKYGFKIPVIEDPAGLNRAPELESLRSLVEKLKKGAENCGAMGIFLGFVRKFDGEKIVKRLEYESFNEILAEKIAEVEAKIIKDPGVKNVKIYHKLGKLLPGEDIVYIAVVGEHRKDIWKPLLNAVELMKNELPIWKKEVFENGERWV
ncbi:MAG: molybdenum cofactor biosynthesis protein MoaE [Archaeoglobaceae archaeon]|nr:molybdenum cofactor biosynthesis protein MoaE [Archaeoglobaceae archaeon]MDW8127843.1 molybdenum cofactor biosynthesis protein MoaE [Archaeoglobaceae archaeon]